MKPGLNLTLLQSAFKCVKKKSYESILSLSTLKWPFSSLILHYLQEQFLKKYFLKKSEAHYKCTFNTIKHISLSTRDPFVLIMPLQVCVCVCVCVSMHSPFWWAIIQLKRKYFKPPDKDHLIRWATSSCDNQTVIRGWTQEMSSARFQEQNNQKHLLSQLLISLPPFLHSSISLIFSISAEAQGMLLNTVILMICLLSRREERLARKV